MTPCLLRCQMNSDCDKVATTMHLTCADHDPLDAAARYAHRMSELEKAIVRAQDHLRSLPGQANDSALGALLRVLPRADAGFVAAAHVSPAPEAELPAPRLYYSGEASVRFWARVNALPDGEKKHDAWRYLYRLGCALQDLERYAIGRLEDEERVAKLSIAASEKRS